MDENSSENSGITTVADRMNGEYMRTRTWPCLVYEDAPAAIEFLKSAFGFVIGELHEAEGGEIAHAELLWPEGGGVMLGTAGLGDSPFANRKTGNDAVYVVCSDPDALLERARAAGAEVFMEPRDTDYGSRDVGIRDPEGNLWDFGTYPGSSL